MSIEIPQELDLFSKMHQNIYRQKYVPLPEPTSCGEAKLTGGTVR